MDLFKRYRKKENTDAYFLNSSKIFTLFWGVFAIIVACIAPLFDNLIQLVNIVGSIFYGNVLGIFLAAFFIKYIGSRAIFTAGIITQAIVIIAWWYDWMPYLWLNLLGCFSVILIALLIQGLQKR